MNARKSFMQVATALKPLQHLLFDRVSDPACHPQFVAMLEHTLMKRAVTGIAGAVDLAVLVGERIHAG